MDTVERIGSNEPSVVSEYLTFQLGSEEYAIDILRVQEIRGYEAVTRIANLPEFIKGVVNLRGTIVPIVDLRTKFGLPFSYTPTTVVIVINILERVIGIVVDSVSDVVQLSAGDILPAPGFSAQFDTHYILGLATLDNRMLIVTDIIQLMSGPEMALLHTVAA